MCANEEGRHVERMVSVKVRVYVGLGVVQNLSKIRMDMRRRGAM